MIASENFVCEGGPGCNGVGADEQVRGRVSGKRYYGGCELVDQAESLAIERAKKVFGAEHVNVQPHSGSQANMAVYMAVLTPGDTILGMNLSHGGHLTHGSPVNFSGKLYNVVAYGVRGTRRPSISTRSATSPEAPAEADRGGPSAYPRTIDFAKFREIADEAAAW
jgi:glycine hydroxymethyltransferase